mgnify:CR=1 FL=1
MIDATIVRAHACAAGYVKNGQEKEALGRSKGGFTPKIHALVDALGNPLAFKLTGGQRHEITQASALLGESRGTWIIADKGYDSNAFIQHIQKRQGTPVTPKRKNRTKPRGYDRHWYRERHLIECFFGKTKHFRHVFSRLINRQRFSSASLSSQLYSCGSSKISYTEPNLKFKKRS